MSSISGLQFWSLSLFNKKGYLHFPFCKNWKINKNLKSKNCLINIIFISLKIVIKSESQNTYNVKIIISKLVSNSIKKIVFISFEKKQQIFFAY